MTTNRLAKSNGSAANFKSAIRASEWARVAREKGYVEQAKAWEAIDQNAWDEAHYDPNWDPVAKCLK